MLIYHIFSAFVYAVGRPYSDKKNFNADVDFVYRQYRNLPWYFRVVFACLALLLDLALMKGLLPFHRQQLRDRLHRIERLKRLNLGVTNDFLTFFNGLTAFSVYSDPSREADG